jgi:hypothetical protein
LEEPERAQPLRRLLLPAAAATSATANAEGGGCRMCQCSSTNGHLTGATEGVEAEESDSAGMLSGSVSLSGTGGYDVSGITSNGGGSARLYWDWSTQWLRILK